MMNRKFTIDYGCREKKVCYLDFKNVCERDVYSADYHAICTHFHTIYLSGIPKLDLSKHDIARRFLTFVDVVYDNSVRLIFTSEYPPLLIFNNDSVDDASVESDASEFDGTSSVPHFNLIEVSNNNKIKGLTYIFFN
jgi:predicted ATPase